MWIRDGSGWHFFSKLASTDRVMLLGQLRPSFDGAAVDFAGAGKKG